MSGLDEARAYLRHPVLRGRLTICTAAVNAVTGQTAHQVFGCPDDMKFCSALFGSAAPAIPVYWGALTRYYEGKEDPRTRAKLGRS
ncbi:DUF1810 family protein [Methylorubrum thiocyanatum]|uniref:DUF1810 family protein n=1 Tax=Methylorubrum thiocyanatum TaxID=47958 RepID=UPI001EFA56FB|nr:DUF1810 family protein [Methylorubrum thiocyanatum]